MSKENPPQNTSIETFSIDDLSYDLPEDLIAQEPLSVRHQSRLLIADRKTGSLKHKKFADIVEFVNPEDLIVVNDTRVIPARLIARRATGGSIKIQLVKQIMDPSNLNSYTWEAMAMPLKRVKVNETIEIETSNGKTRKAFVDSVITDSDGYKRLIVNFLSNENMRAVLKESGHAPLPPYIKRDLSPSDELLNEKRQQDLERYQTVFAAIPGAVAAPTAGLHFSEIVLHKLKEKGANIAKITLHVGAGTFKPITSSIEEHSIEEEYYSINEETAALINKTKAKGNRVIAVGTTSLRALESAGASSSSSEVTACQNQATSLYVKPGFKFQIVDALVTNFHLSGSSLLVLVATFAGKDLILEAYQDAIDMRYRFYSYGDAMLIL